MEHLGKNLRGYLPQARSLRADEPRNAENDGRPRGGILKRIFSTKRRATSVSFIEPRSGGDDGYSQSSPSRQPHRHSWANSYSASSEHADGPKGNVGRGAGESPLSSTWPFVGSGSSTIADHPHLPFACHTPRSDHTRSTCSTPHDYPRSASGSGADGSPYGVRNFTPRTGGASSSSSSSREVIFMYASPLDICLDARLRPIDFHAEAETLHQVFMDARSEAQLKIGAATADSLTNLLTLARARQGVVVHLSAHAIRDKQKGVGLVLEDANGGPHILWRQQLEDLLSVGLSNISLLVLSTCHSDEVAQIFVECGCKHVVYTREEVLDTSARLFAKKFYLELAMGQSLSTAWEASMQALRIDPNPKVAKEADRFMLYGQVGAERATLENLCGTEGASIGMPGTSFADMSVYMDMQLRTRPENFLGRQAIIYGMFRAFSGRSPRRTLLVHGPKGIGKTALAIEFAHFATAPGRLFSCAPLFLKLSAVSGLDETIEAIEEQLEPLARHLGVLRAAVERPPSAGSRMSDWDSSSRSDSGYGPLTLSDRCQDRLAEQASARARIRKTFQQIEKKRPLAKILLVVDDTVGVMRASENMRLLLGDLVEHTSKLHFLILSRDPIYEAIGQTKIVNEPLEPLNENDAAKLFLQRSHRQLEPRDLDKDARAGLPHSLDVAAAMLREHPLMRRLGGHPGDICTVSAQVRPGGPSLLELAAQVDLLEPPPVPAPQLLNRQRSMPAECQRGGQPYLAQAARPYSASPSHGPWGVDLR